MVMCEDGGGTTTYRGDSSGKLKLYILKLVGHPMPYHIYEMLVSATSEEEAKRVLPPGVTQQEAHKYGVGLHYNWEASIVGHATSNVVLTQCLMYRQNTTPTPPAKTKPKLPTPPKVVSIRDGKRIPS